MKTKLSRITLSALAVCFIAGIGFGYYLYLHHPAVKPNIPANNAIPIHIAIAICAAVAFSAIQTYRVRKQLSTIWAAPFSDRAFQRYKATILLRNFSWLSIPRLLACLLLLIIILFTPFRMGAQIGDAFDPTLAANAWGGPSYTGASLAHGVDLVIFLYVAALLLNVVMVKKSTKSSIEL